MKRSLLVLTAFTLLSVFAYLVGKPKVVAWLMEMPATAFDDTALPPAPDYTNMDHWAALPHRADSADWLPRGSKDEDHQAEAPIDVFYVHPTAAFNGKLWVAGVDHRLARQVLDRGIIPQQATPFNGIGKIYAPRYRSVRMPIWWSTDRDSVDKATALAYQDVKAAFTHYRNTWNLGRPLILASHSQGTMHLLRLLQEEFDGKALGKQLLVAYLIGSSVPSDALSDKLPVCNEPDQLGCYVSWNTMLKGGSTSIWLEDKSLDRIVCVNPLSWRQDTAAVDRAQNHGSIPMIGIGAAIGKFGPLQQQVVGARCGDRGILWIDERPGKRGYSTALFADGYAYHSYDINFYYASIRDNARLRGQRYLQRSQESPG